MMLAAARFPLKLHRFEVAVAAFAAIMVGIAALIVAYRLRALGVDPACVDGFLGRVDSGGIDAACMAAMHAWGNIIGPEGSPVFGVLGFLPFAAGLLVGVPIVARELETRTAQTAWSLYGSRLRWYLRSVIPVAVVVGIPVLFAGLSASLLAADRTAWGDLVFFDLGKFGPLVLARAFAAMGVGLLAGALLGRTLPAFVLGAALCGALLLLNASAQERWLASLQPTAVATLSPVTGEYDTPPTMITTAWGAWTPDGRLLAIDEAIGIARAHGAALPEPGDEQDLPALGWLERNGYVLTPIGISEEAAMGWGLYEAVGLTVVGAVSMAGAMLVVNRRRPT